MNDWHVIMMVEGWKGSVGGVDWPEIHVCKQSFADICWVHFWSGGGKNLIGSKVKLVIVAVS